MTKQEVQVKRFGGPCRAIVCAVASMGMLATLPAMAETEIEQLKRELTEQRQLIDQLIRAQNAQVVAASSAIQPPATAAGTASKPVFTVYGTLDVNTTNVDNGNGRKTVFGTGGMSASSLGVKGVKELTPTLRAVGEFEAALAINTGVVSNGAASNGTNNTVPSSGSLLGSGPQLFSRQAYVGLAGGVGTLTIGRQYTPSYLAAAGVGAAMGGGFYGNGATIMPFIGGMPTRWNNSISYKSPSFSGLSTQVVYSTGSQNNLRGDSAPSAMTTNDQAGRGVDAGLSYNSGALKSSATMWSFNANSYNATLGETGLAKKKGGQLAANYDFGYMKLYGSYASGKIEGGNYENGTKTLSDSSGASVSVSMPFGASRVYLNYTRITDKSLLMKDLSLFGVAYTYELAKGQKLYANWGKLSNNRFASYALTDGSDIVGGTATPGFDPSAFMVGVNLTF